MAFLSDLFAKKEKSVLGSRYRLLVIESRTATQGTWTSSARDVWRACARPYGGSEVGQATNLSAEQVTETLKDLLREAKVTTKMCGVSIPFARSLLTLVTLPYRKDSAEQKTVIELEARKFIPVPISEVQLDWFVVPQADPTQSTEDDPHAISAAHETIEVLVVAVHNDELSLLQSVIAGAELEASFYELEIFSTIRAVVEEQVRPVMVLDVGAASTKTYIIEYGVVVLSHALSVGSQDITRAISVSNNVSIARAEAMKKRKALVMRVRMEG